MKMVVAIIRHERLQEVQDVLDECGVSGVTVTEVKGCGAQRGYTEKYRGTAVNISLRPRLKIETNTLLRISSGFHRKRAGHTCEQTRSSQLSARRSTMRWSPSSVTILR